MQKKSPTQHESETFLGYGVLYRKLFGSGSLGCRSFSCGSLSSGSCSRLLSIALAAATGAAGLLGGCILEHVFVVVNELNDTGLGVVTKTVASLEDTGVTTVAVSDLLSYFTEEFGNGILVLQVREHQTAVRSVVLLSAVDKGLSIHAEGLSLGKRSVDALVHDERDGHVGKQSVAVSLLATKVVERFIVSHRILLFI